MEGFQGGDSEAGWCTPGLGGCLKGGGNKILFFGAEMSSKLCGFRIIGKFWTGSVQTGLEWNSSFFAVNYSAIFLPLSLKNDGKAKKNEEKRRKTKKSERKTLKKRKRRKTKKWENSSKPIYTNPIKNLPKLVCGCVKGGPGGSLRPSLSFACDISCSSMTFTLLNLFGMSYC